MKEKYNDIVQAEILGSKFNEILGRKMYILRKEIYGWGQEYVAEKLGYNAGSYISNIERGVEGKGMKKEKIFEAAELFQVHPIALLSPRPLNKKQLQLMILSWRLTEDENNPYLDSVLTLLKAAIKHQDAQE